MFSSNSYLPAFALSLIFVSSLTLTRSTNAQTPQAEPTTRYGIGLRLRTVFVPATLLETTYFEYVPHSMNNVGVGVEFIRRRGNMELSLGLEYESLGIEDGYWRDKDDVVDFVVFDGFSWIGLDASYVTNQPITRKVAFRIGTGLGVAVVLGDIFRTEQLCEPGEPNATRCRIHPNPDRVNEPMDLPTILPIFNFILGLQIQPSDDVRINIESGTRTVFYGGVTVSYFFK